MERRHTRADQPLRASLKEIDDLKAALDRYAIVAITDSEGKITYINDKFCAISQYSREELLGQDHRIVNSGYYPKQFIHELWTIITQGKVWKGEFRNRARDGTFFWVETTIIPFLNDDGTPRQYIAIHVDITGRKVESPYLFVTEHIAVRSDILQRKEAEDKLKKSLKEIGDFKAALDEHAIVAITDSQGKITYVNDKFCAISKYAREELLGQDHRLINSSHHPKEFIRELWTTIAQGHVWKGEIKNRAKDGTFYWVATTIVPFLNEDGKPRQYIAIRADITQRKEAEEKLKHSLKEIGDLKSALDEHAIVAITDAQGRITYVNDKFCAISKYAREELLGQDHRLINSSHHPKEFIRELWTTIAQGKVWKGEIKNRAKDGTFYWVDTTIVPFLNEDGKPRQYIAIRADITQRKAAEEKIQQMNVELEKRIGERTAELERSNQELEQFAYVASHDMREPLRAVSGFAQILKRNCQNKLDGRDHEMIGQIVDGAKRMADIIDDLLALSRIGSQKRLFEKTEIEKPLELALKNLSVIIRERKAMIRHDPLPSLPVDELQLALLFQNLIGNAIKFCDLRTPEIQVSATRAKDAFWTISVRDNGIGIEPKYFERIFGIFQRLHTRAEYPGTGIGLAICKKIVERHGGWIWLESTAGSGTTFHFTLPERQKNG